MQFIMSMHHVDMIIVKFHNAIYLELISNLSSVPD